ncbi:hypothetical protein VTK56DRAFT_7820 [Thermocarpiscus australiensis]
MPMRAWLDSPNCVPTTLHGECQDSRSTPEVSPTVVEPGIFRSRLEPFPSSPIASSLISFKIPRYPSRIEQVLNKSEKNSQLSSTTSCT